MILSQEGKGTISKEKSRMPKANGHPAVTSAANINEKAHKLQEAPNNKGGRTFLEVKPPRRKWATRKRWAL